MDVVSSDAKTLVNLRDGITQFQSGIKNQLWEDDHNTSGGPQRHRQEYFIQIPSLKLMTQIKTNIFTTHCFSVDRNLV